MHNYSQFVDNIFSKICTLCFVGSVILYISRIFPVYIASDTEQLKNDMHSLINKVVKLLSDVCYLALVAPSGECIQGESRAYLIGLLARKYRLLAASSAVLNPVVAVLRNRLLFYTCKVERLVLTVIKKKIIIIINIIFYTFGYIVPKG